MRKLLLRWIINAVAVYVAMYLVGGITAGNVWTIYPLVALILGLVNALVAPLIKVLTCPLILLTLGLFTLVINGLMLRLTSAIAVGLGIDFYVAGFRPALLGSIVISVVSFGLSVLTGVNKEEDN